MDLTAVVCVLAFIIIVRFLSRSDPPKINGIYSQPNKWYLMKFMIFKFLLWLRKLEKNKKVTGENAGMGRKSRNSPEDMDKVQLLPKEHPKAVDAVYLTGSNKEGQFLVTATARRHDNHVQTIVYLRLPDLGFLELPSMPDTSLRGTMENEFAAGGLHISMVEPMKTWSIKFDGKLRQVSLGKLLDVKFDLTWRACTKFFDFDTDLHPDVLCDAIARETWSRHFFNTLKTIHQTHYEQFGDTTGTVNIEGHDTVNINIRGVRDHSYGNIRNWRQLHRYCIQYANFPDGTNLCLSAISMPATMSRLHCGFIFHPSGEMDTVSWHDLEFHNLGDDGTPSTNFTVNFKAGEQQRTLKVVVIETRQFYIGDGRDAKIYERYARYFLDGMEGYGLSKWEYCNTDGTEPENNMGLNY
ncbi:uncharacterized protein LOC132748017 [Ruditapes philippinarum]|uniref:uncharacterized protein LOC132748017 n=1 Tax=Ruditapes philippinarum TaxID=129788 RepID=UPI00295BD9C1|nr:uncharacterized protein LOC132748017 [Ruditapes philippinarum]